jgi:hypothetical protein
MRLVFADTQHAPDAVGAHEQRMQHALHTLSSAGWERRLAPLAQHMAAQCLVRSCGYAGAPMRQLDLTLLREALSRLLRAEWAGASLIVELVVNGTDPAQVATARSVSRPTSMTGR